VKKAEKIPKEIALLCLYCPKLDKKLLECKLKNPQRTCPKKRVRKFLRFGAS